MTETAIFTYESLYYELWETARGYRAIAHFRVIGNSHDERMIPMIEVGQGDQVIFCRNNNFCMNGFPMIMNYELWETARSIYYDTGR